MLESHCIASVSHDYLVGIEGQLGMTYVSTNLHFFKKARRCTVYKVQGLRENQKKSQLLMKVIMLQSIFATTVFAPNFKLSQAWYRMKIYNISFLIFSICIEIVTYLNRTWYFHSNFHVQLRLNETAPFLNNFYWNEGILNRDRIHYRAGGTGCAGCAAAHPFFGSSLL